jgi:hypothetical protein
MNLNHSYIGPDELIYNNDGEIHSGGFSVNSIMLKNGLSPIMTLNNNNAIVNANTNQIGGEKVSDLFNNLVIPNWSLSYNYKNGPVYEGGANGVIYNSNKKRSDDEDDDEVMEEELHDKLLNLVKVDKTEMKNSIVSNKKTSKKHFKTTMKTKKTVTKRVTKNATKSNKA